MGELEDQIARLAQARADQVPPYQAPASLDRARASRRGVWFAVAAAITAVVVAAGALLWDRGDDPSVRTAPAPATEVPAPTTVAPTTPTTTPAVATACPEVTGIDTNPKSGSGHPGSAQLKAVQIQTSDCVDEVTFTFGTGLPNWSVEYRTGPFTLDPSGQPLSIEGDAFLFVRFEHGEGVRSNDDAARDVFAGPLSHVTEVRQTQDFEGIVTWIIGLDTRAPFTVVDRSDGDRGRIVVAIPEVGEARAVRCAVPGEHFELAVPPGWYTELNDDVRCHLFAPEPSSDRRVLVDVSPSTSVAGLFGPSPVMSSMTTADGRTASCLEGVYVGSDSFPAGQPGFVCSVGWGDGQNLTVTTNGYAGPRYADYKAGVQAIVGSARYLP